MPGIPRRQILVDRRPGPSAGAWPAGAFFGFTLIELLVVLAIIALLAALSVPALRDAIERAKVAKVLVELRQIELGLEMYVHDHGGYPPVRVSCNTSEREHWCQLPPELVEGGYLPGGGQHGMSSDMHDPFHPGHTYKYAAIGPYFLNGAPQPENYGLFIPEDFPLCQGPGGRYREDEQAPVAWVIWSLGPRQSLEKALNARAPLTRSTWYCGAGDNGVIARIKPRDASSFQTP